MHVSREVWIDMYKYFQQLVCNQQDGDIPGKIFVFCAANDVDALATSFILTSLFDSDEIVYSLFPVSDYEDFNKYQDLLKISERPERLGIILINFGAMLPLDRVIQVQNPESRVVVIDRHRPLSLSNLTMDLRYVVFVEEEWERKHQGILAAKQQWEASGGDDLTEEEEDDLSGEIREARNNALDTLNEYQTGEENYRIYTPSCDLVYDLAKQLSRASNKLLWPALIGTTWCWWRGELTEKQYHNLVLTKWHSEAIRLNQSLNPTNLLSAQSPLDQEEPAKHIHQRFVSSATANHNKTSGIQVVRDFKFTLWRHMDMFTSIRNSPYIIGRMQLQTPEGRTDLLTSLAQWGISLEQIKQPHNAMNLPTKTLLTRSILGTHGESSMASSWGLEEVLFAGFVRWFGVGGWQGSASAMDACMAIQALMDGGQGWVKCSLLDKNSSQKLILEVDEDVEDGLPLDSGRAGKQAPKAQQYGIATDTAMDQGLRTERRRIFGALGDLDDTDQWQQPGWKDKWFEAFQAMSKFDILYSGIRIATHLQTSIVRGATSLMYNKAMRKVYNNTFRLFTIAPPQAYTADLGRLKAETGIGRIAHRDWEFYSRSSSTWLVQLGNCFLEMLKNNPKTAKSDIPLVLLVWNGHDDATWTLRGFAHPKRNPFPLAFTRLVDERGVMGRSDAFDPNVMLIESKSITQTLERLGEVLTELQS